MNTITGVAMLKNDTNLSTLNNVSPALPMEQYDDKNFPMGRINPNVQQNNRNKEHGDIVSTMQLSQRQPSTIETPGLTAFEKSKQHLSHFASGQMSQKKDPSVPGTDKIMSSSTTFGVKMSKAEGLDREPSQFGQS